MISNGITGYNTGNMNQPVGTILAMTAGPIVGRNWYSATNPAYQIYVVKGPLASSITGVVELQGTNDVQYQSNAPTNFQVEGDILPTESSTWTTLATTSGGGLTSGTFSTGYEFLRLVISTQGGGFVQNAWVRWK